MEDHDSIMKEYHDEMKRIYKEEQFEKNEYKKKLRGLINVTGLYRSLDEDQWMPEGIVDVVFVDEKKNGYGDTQCARVKDDGDGLLYLKISSDVRGVDHYYVWQISTGMEGDSFSGFMLWPLKSGQYFKVSYSC